MPIQSVDAELVGAEDLKDADVITKRLPKAGLRGTIKGFLQIKATNGAIIRLVPFRKAANGTTFYLEESGYTYDADQPDPADA